jgi:hypothetical protein
MDLRHESVALDKMSVEEKADWKHMERGWVHGSKEFRKRMGDILLEEGKSPEELEQKREVSEAAATEVLSKCLAYYKLAPSDLLAWQNPIPASF